MKMLPTKVIEVSDEGFVALLGQQVEIITNRFIYTGILVGVNTNCVKIDDAAIVYETGEHSAPKYKDAQRLGRSQYIMFGLMESFGVTGKSY